MIDRFAKQQRAIDLIRVGFRTPIVVVETDMSNSAVRDIAKIMSGGKRPSSGPMPSPNSMLNSVGALAEASLFAGIYRNLGGEAIYTSIDVDVLICAFNLYKELRQSHFADGRDDLLDINRAWVIARDLRSSIAWLKKCEDDGYYLVVDQQRVPSGCPWCSVKKSKIKSRMRKRDIVEPQHAECAYA